MPLSKNYKNSITYIRNDILLGKSLSEAFSKFDELYPGLFIGVLKVGENSGQLGRTFNKLEMFYSKLGNIKKEVKNALIYPSFLIVTLILLGVFFLLLFAGVHIFLAIMTASLLTCAYIGVDLQTMTMQVIKGVNVYSLMAVPFFILAGEIMGAGGITDRLVTLSKTLVG